MSDVHDVERPVDRERLRAEIASAFATAERPPDWALRRCDLGEEPYRVEKEFQDRQDWRTLDAAFLDQAPGGLGSALSFLSDAAFRYFLPAYLLADLDGSLERVDPVFYLCHGLDDATCCEPVNPRLYGARSWFDAARYRFAVFTVAEARAIVGYLRYRAAADPTCRREIEEAIRNYWGGRAAPGVDV